MKYFFLLFFFTSIHFFVIGQEWQKLDSLCYEYGESNPDTAIILGKKAIEGCIKEKGKNSLEYAVCLDHIAWAYAETGKTHTADSLYGVAVSTLKEIKLDTSSHYVELLGNRAYTYLYDELIEKAEQCYIEAIEISRKHLDTTKNNYANLLTGLAGIYRRKDEYTKSEQLYLMAINILHTYQKKPSAYNIVFSNNLGNLYRYMGLNQKAIGQYKEAIEIHSKLHNKKDMEYAKYCANMASAYKDEKLYSVAESLYVECVHIIKNSNNKSSYITLCNNLGNLYTEQKMYDKAESVYKEALKNNLEISKNTAIYARTLIGFANLYIAKGQYDKAENFSLQAMNIRKKLFGEESSEYGFSCLSLSVLYMYMKLYDKAKHYVYIVEPIFTKIIHKNLTTLSESEKSLFLRDLGYYDFIALINSLVVFTQDKKLASLGYQMCLEAKGLILNDTEKIRHRILHNNDENLIKTYHEWKKSKTEYIKYISLPIEEKKTKKYLIDSLEQKANQYEKSILFKNQEFSTLFNQQKITSKDIQKKMKKGEASIEITKYQDTLYMAYILKKNSTYPEVVLFSQNENVEKFYIGYQREIKHKINDVYSYDIFWKPLSAHLKGISKIYFSPAGVFHKINLNTLHDETNTYLIDKYDIVFLNNSKDILKNKENGSGNFYLVGNPLYEEKENASNSFMEGISPLPGSEKEVKAIDSLLKQKQAKVSVIIGKEAKEEYIKSIQNAHLIHIATHGFWKQEAKNEEQAMLNSGLLFAGVADYNTSLLSNLNKEDGLLTALEITTLNLDNTELVVLSACETGMGNYNEEGLYGLQRAFKTAGTNSIITSLWKVDDNTTQELMKTFYFYWQIKGMEKRQAFRKAQLSIREKYNYEYYWGAFVMIE
jgi:CHAT domain-containing protein